ncbi:hypothetical protein IGI04_002227 [Brassica rapa subsp. trilocularis]|uniref:Disease resistance protein Roq1-like winged-helix domain-containing protein n=1 Tax=Brassica rapa subsp. trilocularis TaxID=1813537 RepID=A0ABQ7NUW9_BRACM|nr:hypothetical protein IGI04_002227 [Brassica rapa subsp. trilocularis]
MYKRLCNQKVVSIDQLDALAKDIYCFCPIVTTYGFWRSSQHYGFENQAVRVIERCGNLPSGLRVVGSSLREKSGDALDGDLERVLRFRHDSLHEKDQALFLHIEILFNHKDKDNIKPMHGDCKLDVEYGLRNLVNSSLIDIYTDGVIVIQQIGRQVIHGQEPWKHHVLIDPHEICDLVLSYYIGRNTQERFSQRDFISKISWSSICVTASSRSSGKDLRTLRSFKCKKNLERLSLNDCMSMLKTLSMYACEKREVIRGHMNLAPLERLDMTLCQRLRNFPEISRNISWFSISVEELEKVPESIRLWYHLRVLTITSKGKLNLLAHLPQGVTHLHISDIGVQWMSCRKKSGQRESKEGLACPYATTYTEINYTNCFKLDQEAHKAILENNSYSLLGLFTLKRSACRGRSPSQRKFLDHLFVP